MVLNGYGWTRQRFSAEGILGRERLQRRQIIRLRCHNFEPNRPVSVVVKHIAIGAGGFRFLGPHRLLAQLLCAQVIGAEGLGIDSRDGQIGKSRQRLATAATFLCHPSAKGWTPVMFAGVGSQHSPSL